jgi:hypothetical protein
MFGHYFLSPLIIMSFIFVLPTASHAEAYGLNLKQLLSTITNQSPKFRSEIAKAISRSGHDPSDISCFGQRIPYNGRNILQNLSSVRLSPYKCGFYPYRKRIVIETTNPTEQRDQGTHYGVPSLIKWKWYNCSDEGACASGLYK